MKIKKLVSLLLALCVLMQSTLCAQAKDEEQEQGTKPEELKALQLPLPAETKVAVLPFWDVKSEAFNIRTATSIVWLRFWREGFQMTPIKEGFEAVANDGQMEPGLPMRGMDAVRVGKELGVDWVVYGELKELEDFKKSSFWSGTRKLMDVGVRIAVADVETGKIVYWKVRSERINRGLNKFEKSVRSNLLLITLRMLTPLFEALPEHEVIRKDHPSTDEVAEFVEKNWPEK